MTQNDQNRSRIIGLRLNPQEYQQIEQQWKNSTCRKLSEYVRRHLFNQPIVQTYRNTSLDDTIAELTQLRQELNRIGVNFNQAVKRLHTLDTLPEFNNWLVTYEQSRRLLFAKTEEIKEHTKKLTELWLR